MEKRSLASLLGEGLREAKILGLLAESLISPLEHQMEGVRLAAKQVMEALQSEVAKNQWFIGLPEEAKANIRLVAEQRADKEFEGICDQTIGTGISEVEINRISSGEIREHLPIALRCLRQIDWLNCQVARRLSGEVLKTKGSRSLILDLGIVKISAATARRN